MLFCITTIRDEDYLVRADDKDSALNLFIQEKRVTKEYVAQILEVANGTL